VQPLSRLFRDHRETKTDRALTINEVSGIPDTALRAVFAAAEIAPPTTVFADRNGVANCPTVSVASFATPPSLEVSCIPKAFLSFGSMPQLLIGSSSTTDSRCGNTDPISNWGHAPEGQEGFRNAAYLQRGGVAKEATDTVGQFAHRSCQRRRLWAGLFRRLQIRLVAPCQGYLKLHFIVSARSVCLPVVSEQTRKRLHKALGPNWANLARRGDQARAKMDQFSGAMAKMPQSVQLDFIHRVESGMKQPTPELQQAADTMRQLLDERWKEVNALGKLDAYVDDYFPHFWKDPGPSGKGESSPCLGLRNSGRSAPCRQCRTAWRHIWSL